MNSLFYLRRLLSFLLILLIITFGIIISGCSSEPAKKEKNGGTLKVYVSIYPFEYFARAILPDADIESLVPTGVDPHHFEPSLKDIQKLHTADIVIYIGDTDVDRWIDKVKPELTSRGVRVIRLQDNLRLMNYKSSKEIDPHIWLDPLLVLDASKEIKERALQISSVNSDKVIKNFQTLESKLKELDSMYRDTLSKCSLKDVVSTHEFLNYLAAKYGFKAHSIVHEPEDEPSPKKIKNLKELVKREKIEYIITEQEGERIAKALSQEAGVKVLGFNTYHTKTEKDYISVMTDNLNALATALKCETKRDK